jgi:hypothetical protein
LLVAGLALASLAGCSLWPRKPACQDDPLLLAKKPVAGTESPAPAPLLLAQAEPILPALPLQALALDAEPAENPQVKENPQPAPPESSDPPQRPTSPRVPAVPASRSKPSGASATAADEHKD